jgi:asparagine synthase (glutamine-hydrolysing)
VADYLQLDLCEVPFSKQDFDRLAPIATYYKDTPLVHPNSVAILKLSQAIRANKVTVILSGEGADEVFGGYQKYIDYFRVLKLRRFLPRLNKSLIPLIGDENTLRSMVDHEVAPIDLWRVWPVSDGRNDVQNSLRDQFSMVGESRIGAEVSSLIAKDIQYYLNPLLRRADRMTMAVGIEGRVPMLDQRVLEFGINLPSRYKVRFFKGGKYLLKRVAERYLPKEIVWRKKKGLPIPVEQWTGVTSKLGQKEYFLDLWFDSSRPEDAYNVYSDSHVS